MNEPLVIVEGASKKFCRNLKRSLWYGLQDMGREITGRRHGGNGELRPQEFWAVRDVSFELKRGECLGLLGRNGAGKTTLLKMLNGLVKPDQGRIEMRGRVGALIALGAGFNPILTGRENIYVNGSILGLSKREIDAKIDEIVDFAEIADFIDTPVQNYSSGMAVKLGFSIATTVNPDILLLDEVLAVGDASFRNKCYNRIAKIRKNAAVILVSHHMEQVGRTCDSIAVMAKGALSFFGGKEEGIALYEKLNANSANDDELFISHEWPLEHYRVTPSTDSLKYGESLTLRIDVASKERIPGFMVKLVFYNASGQWAAESNYSHPKNEAIAATGTWSIVIATKDVPLRNGYYRLGIILMDQKGSFLGWSYKEHGIQVEGSHSGAGADCLIDVASAKVSATR